MSNANKTEMDVEAIRKDFPILHQTIHRDRPLIYFDSGASSQRPTAVIQAMEDCYKKSYANVHRGIHFLSEQASWQYEQARRGVAKFINAPDEVEVVFTSGTTAALNVVARSWGDENVSPGDEIVLTIFEHHSNIVPWQQLAARKGATVRFAQIDDQGQLDMAAMREMVGEKTKVIAFAAISNVLGTIVPVQEVVELAHSVGAIAVVDAAQSVPHEKTDVQKWNADFVAFSGHKMLGPSGIGVLWGKRDLLEVMPPFLGGGSMINDCTVDGFSPGELPAKFEAGTPPIAEAIGLGAAVDYLNECGIAAIGEHEKKLVGLAYQRLEAIDGLKILGPSAGRRSGLASFIVDGVSAQDMAVLLDQKGIAIRAGHHCAMPLHVSLDARSSCRASFYLYNTTEEVESFAEVLANVISRLR